MDYQRTKPTGTRLLASVAVFAALALALQIVPLRIPAPYAPFLIYQFWEIPIVIAFLLFGPLAGILVAVVNFLGLLVIFPGVIATGPLYNLIAILSMLLGVFVVHGRFGSRISLQIQAGTATGFGALLRVGIMTIVNYVLLPFPPPVGLSIPTAAVIGILPLIALFNASVTSYTVLIAEFLARGVSVRMQVAAWGFPAYGVRLNRPDTGRT